MCVEELGLLFGVSRATVNRWLRYFGKVFPNSVLWQRVRGRVSPVVRNDNLPRTLIEHLVVADKSIAGGLRAALQLLAAGQSRFPGVDPFHAKGDFMATN